ncbi:TPA: hypothetical protein ACNUZK_003635 [Citrobacter braakii]|jgi:hypothetical protein|uniref:hypothetical protein n=1 Tax=Citrobacter TaxID=544 RepID=UPI0019004B36|nr:MULTISPECIES: hypothetical protein [Citrobacter]MBJ8823635.1 hypothetical protein [Citrobacter freundii]MBJ9143662.1 hypothetical protein [Citrobacter braakii]MDM3352394.1 hypothetical protein [Citrobacter sp. Cb007]MDT7086199.1 hypothetical protein [Citrobacter europaeus]
MTSIGVAILALVVAIWHEINRFPATNKSIISLQNAVTEVKEENERLSSDIGLLQSQLSDALDQIDRLRDPEYYALLDADDGAGLYELEKSRSEG